jgi:hypothetical protein
MNNLVFNNFYIKYELYRHIPITEIHANKLEIPKYCIRFLFIHLIVRKIGISCKLIIIRKIVALLLSSYC